MYMYIYIHFVYTSSQIVNDISQSSFQILVQQPIYIPPWNVKFIINIGVQIIDILLIRSNY